MPFRRLLPCFAALALAGCDLVGVDCTTSVEPGIIIEIYDASTLEPLAEAAEAEIRDGAYIEVLVAGSTLDNGEINARLGAYERPGTYDITVEHPDYQIFTRDDVLVREGQCHVITRTIQAELVPSQPVNPMARR